jgi:hypothetical protein
MRVTVSFYLHRQTIQGDCNNINDSRRFKDDREWTVVVVVLFLLCIRCCHDDPYQWKSGWVEVSLVTSSFNSKYIINRRENANTCQKYFLTTFLDYDVSIVGMSACHFEIQMREACLDSKTQMLRTSSRHTERIKNILLGILTHTLPWQWTWWIQCCCKSISLMSVVQLA